MVENISEIDTNDQFIDTHQELSFDESIYETANKYPEKLTAQLANFHDVFSEGTRLLIDGFLNADDRKVENLKEVVYAMFKDNYMLNFEGDIESFIVKRKEVEELAVTLAESSNYNMQFSKFTRLTIDYAYKMFEGNKHNSPLMNIVEDSLNVEYSNLLNFAKSHLQENELNPDNFYLRAGRVGEVVSGRILHSDENYVSIVKAMFSQDDHITVVSRSELPDKLPPQQELISFVVNGIDSNKLNTELQLHDKSISPYSRGIALAIAEERLACEIELASELASEERLPAKMTAEGIKELHRRLYQDSYEWAGIIDGKDQSRAEANLNEMLLPLRVLIGGGQLNDLDNKNELFVDVASKFLKSMVIASPFKEYTSLSTGLVLLREFGHAVGISVNLSTMSEGYKEYCEAQCFAPGQGLDTLYRSLITDLIDNNRQQNLDIASKNIAFNGLDPNDYFIRNALNNEKVEGSLFIKDKDISLIQVGSDFKSHLVIIDTKSVTTAQKENRVLIEGNKLKGITFDSNKSGISKLKDSFLNTISNHSGRLNDNEFTSGEHTRIRVGEEKIFTDELNKKRAEIASSKNNRIGEVVIVAAPTRVYPALGQISIGSEDVGGAGALGSDEQEHSQFSVNTNVTHDDKSNYELDYPLLGVASSSVPDHRGVLAANAVIPEIVKLERSRDELVYVPLNNDNTDDADSVPVQDELASNTLVTANQAAGAGPSVVINDTMTDEHEALAAVKEAEVVSDRNGAVIAEYLGDLAGEGRSSQPDVIRTWFMEGLTSRDKPSLIDNEETERASVPSQYIFDESYLLSIYNDLFEGYNNLYLNDADKNTEILLKLHNILEPLRECDGLVPSIDKFCEVSSQIMTRMHFYAPFDNTDDNNKVVEAFITKLGAVHELNVDFSRIQKERTDYASNCARTSVFNSSYRQIVWDACSPERLKALDMAKEAIINSNINVTPIIRTAYPYEKITGDIVRYDDSIVCIRPSNGSIGNNSDHIIVVDRRNLPEGQLNLNEKVFFTANLDFSYLKDSESEVQSSRPFSRKQNVPNQDYAFSDNNGKEVLFSKRNYTNAKEFQENISYYTDNSMKFNAAALSSNDFKFSAPYLKFLHHSLYSDIFDWAGHIRTEEVISRGGSLKVDMSLDSGSLAHDLDVALAPLSDPDKLRNLSTLELAKVMSKSIENVDYIKPFHHGNLEAMQLFCTKVAAACGKDLNLKYITPSALKYALQVSLLDCDSSVLQDLIHSAMDEQSKERMDLSKNALQDAGVNYSSDTVILTPRVGSEVTGKLIRTYDHFAFIENIESGITKISVVDLTDFMKTGCSSDEYLRFTVSNDINRDYISYYTDDIDNHSVQNGQFVSNGANVLRNKFNYKEQSLLSESISRNTIVPAEILSEISNKHDLSDVNLLKEIHSVMYGDIYAWAGHTRNETVDIDGVRLSTMHNKMVFNNNDNLHNRLSTHSENIMNELDKALEPLKDINSLKKLDNNQFAARLGSVLAKCNRIQPFADGNMQALMEFAMVVGEKCNRPFDFDCSASELSDGLRRAQFIEEYKNEESFVVGQPTILEKEVAAESILDGIWRLSGPSVVSGRANSRALHDNAARLPEAKVSEPVLAHSQQPQANFIPSFVANQNFQNPINPCSGSRPDINDDFNKATSFLKNNASDYDNNIDFSKSISMNKQLSFDNNIKICTYVR
ncbi:hypothetical protein [Pseudochrobactrum sp. MP213Fo]|uniref:hypothetical protein n=1 Tax=Pseudochrobactrum sp. MP213Fo TaxID=3022250 RepID=UPI003BA32BED